MFTHLVITVGKRQVCWVVRLVIIPWYQYAEIYSVCEEKTRVPLLQIPFFVSKVRKLNFWNMWIQLLDCKVPARSSSLIPEHKPEDFTSRFSFSLVSANWSNTETWNHWMTPLSLLALGWHFSCAVWTWRASCAACEWHFSSAWATSVHMDSNLAFWTPREWLAPKMTQENSEENSDGYGKELKDSPWKQSWFLWSLFLHARCS